MRYIVFFLLTYISASAQRGFMQAIKLTNGDSLTINMSEVRTATQLNTGGAKLNYGSPNQARVFNTSSTFASVVSASCGNLVTLTKWTSGSTQIVAINPQFVDKVTNVSGATRSLVVFRETSQPWEVVGSYDAVSDALGQCGGASSAGDNWGSQVVVKTGSTLTGVGTTGSPLKVSTNGITSNEIATGTILFSDIGQNGASSGQVLKWNGTAWVAGTDNTGGGGGGDNWGSQVVATSGVTLTGNGTSGSPLRVANDGIASPQIAAGSILASDLDDMGASSGQVLKWNGSTWVPSTDLTTSTPLPETLLPVIGDGSVGDPITLDSQGVTLAYLAPNAVDSTKIVNKSISFFDIGQNGATNGQVPVWNGNIWIPGNMGGGGGGIDSVVTQAPIIGHGTIADPVALDSLGVTLAFLAPNSVDSTKVKNFSLSTFDIGRNNADTSDILRWNGSMWLPTEAISIGDIAVGDGILGDGSVGDPLTWEGAFVNSPLTGSGTSLVPLDIANNSITATHIAANAVGASELGSNAADSTNIINGGISVFDIGQNGASSGQVLKWNGNMWLPSADNNTGTNLSVSGTSSPLSLDSDTGTDVTITAGTGISLSGAPSNITVTNTGDTDPSNDLTTSSTAGGDISGVFSNLQIVSGAVGNSELASGAVDSTKIVNKGISMFDIGQNGATSGQVPSWNGNMWIPTTPSSGLGGTIADQQIAFGNPTTIAGSNNLKWTGSAVEVIKDAIGTTQSNSNGISLTNTTAAAAGSQQISPPIRWRGNGWKTNATAASQTVDFAAWVLPVEGASAPTGTLRYQSSINGGAYSTLLDLTNGSGNSMYLRGTEFRLWPQSGSTSPVTISAYWGGSTAYGMSLGGLTTISSLPNSYFFSLGNPTGYNMTSGTVAESRLASGTFTPTSGTAIFRCAEIQANVNQTGGANGKTYGLYVYSTTLTAADFTGVEIATAGNKGIVQSSATPTNNFNGLTYFGSGSTNATGRISIAGGSTTVPAIRQESGTLNTTALSGAIEYNGSHYMTKGSGLRSGIGGTIADFYTDVNNSGTGETDLYSYTTQANTLLDDGDKLRFNYTLNLSDITSTAQIKILFAGVNIADTGALTVSATGTITVSGILIKTGGTTARASVTINSPTTSTASYTAETDLTGLSFTTTNVLKITGTAGGAGGGSSDITAKLGTISWHPKAAN